MKRLLLAGMAVLLALAPIAAPAQVVPPQIANGFVIQAPSGATATQSLAVNVVATANQAWTSTSFAQPKVMTLCMNASAATTFTVTESVDGTNFYQASLANTVTTANYAPAGAGTLCENIVPAAYVKVASSAAVTVFVQAQASY